MDFSAEFYFIQELVLVFHWLTGLYDKYLAINIELIGIIVAKYRVDANHLP